MIYKSNRLAPSSDIVTNKSRNHLFLAVTVTLCLAGAERAMAQRIWTGGGTDAKWSTANNWSTSPPTAFGGAINFSGNTRQSSTNDISNVLLGQLTFGNDGTATKSGGFALSGNSFTTSNIIITTAVSGSTSSGTMLTDKIGMNIDMTRSPLQIFNINIGNNHHLEVNGVLSSNNGSGLLRRGPGNLILGGANNFSGVTQLAYNF